MSKSQKSMLFINSLILPIIPLLLLYNQNSKYLYFPQIAVLGLILIFIVAIFYIIIRFVFKSEFFSFLSCLFFVILLFAHNNIYDEIYPYGYSSISLLLLVPLLSYILIYIFYKIFYGVQFDKLLFPITVFVFIMLGINLYPLIQNEKAIDEKNLEIKYKSNFVIDDKLPSPNVYWFFCDGMLGFDAMKTYFNDAQVELTNTLIDRGFVINKAAMLETGHNTRIAIPTLMCPDYYDKNLYDILANHETAMELAYASDNKLYNSRVYNEIINAFDKKGYSTTTISIGDIYFFPKTDYFYYINASDISARAYVTKPYYVKKDYNVNDKYEKSRIYAYQLGDIFLGGIPGTIYDKLHKNSVSKRYQLSTTFDFTSDILLGNSNHEVHKALVESLYDAIKSADNEPKFVLIHDMMAHRPFEFNEMGDKIDDPENIKNYPGHHTYSTKVLVNLVDMVIEVDPNAMIILQADHGLHEQSEEQIIEGLGDSGAAIYIWNNVFSAIRVPEQYKNGDEHFAITDPRNISRYLVNSFVGTNYSFVEDK